MTLGLLTPVLKFADEVKRLAVAALVVVAGGVSLMAEVVESEVIEVADSAEVLFVTPVDLGFVAEPTVHEVDSLNLLLPAETDSLIAAAPERVRVFNPDPVRAVWLSALCPGLGQIYNRRYWKLPIIVGGYMGLAYATDWNNTMLRDYTKAYRDLMDNDPDTKSYMDFFAPGVSESSLSKSWLESVFQSRRNYFRRNRDLCIIGMVGVYLLAIVDAYVDASLAHFDITPDLSLNWSPVIIQETRSPLPSVGLQCSLCF